MPRRYKRCNKGWPCGRTCISTRYSCKTNVDAQGQKITETFSQYAERLIKEILEGRPPVEDIQLNPDVDKLVERSTATNLSQDKVDQDKKVRDKEVQDKEVQNKEARDQAGRDQVDSDKEVRDQVAPDKEDLDQVELTPEDLGVPESMEKFLARRNGADYLRRKAEWEQAKERVRAEALFGGSLYPENYKEALKKSSRYAPIADNKDSITFIDNRGSGAGENLISIKYAKKRTNSLMKEYILGQTAADLGIGYRPVEPIFSPPDSDTMMGMVMESPVNGKTLAETFEQGLYPQDLIGNVFQARLKAHYAMLASGGLSSDDIFVETDGTIKFMDWSKGSNNPVDVFSEMAGDKIFEEDILPRMDQNIQEKYLSNKDRFQTAYLDFFGILNPLDITPDSMEQFIKKNIGKLYGGLV